MTRAAMDGRPRAHVAADGKNGSNKWAITRTMTFRFISR
jgi:hypothetical protein